MSEAAEPQNAAGDEDKMAEEFGQQVNYIRQWLDCAPDFPILFQSLMLKIIVDRNGQTPAPEEIANVERWLEGFYKDLSAVMGTLEGHIFMAFPPGQRGPHVQLTDKGLEWMRQNNPEAVARVQAETPTTEE